MNNECNNKIENNLNKLKISFEKVENDFGNPLEEVKGKDEALVVIDRDINLLYGKVRLEEANKKDGYYLIDFDYDKNESFEFNTYVYKKIK